MIKTVGNQTFLSSKINNIAINLAHIIKIIDVDYYVYDEESKEELRGVGILTISGEWTYFGSKVGEKKGQHTVYGDSNLMESIKDLFFS